MVRNASGALSTAPYSYSHEHKTLALLAIGVDALLEDGRGLEDHDPPRRDRHFLAGLRIAADPLTLLAHHERPERGQLDRLAPFQTVRDLLEHNLDQRSGFGTRQAHLLVDRLAQVRACHCFSRHRQAPLSAITYPAE